MDAPALRAREPLLPGLPVDLGGVQLTLPPLSAAAAKLYWQRCIAMQRGEEPDPLGLVAAMVAACLRRNYPAITDEWVADVVDMDNMDALAAMVFGRGSFERWMRESAARAGNAPPPVPETVPAAAGIGAPSTPPSPPPPDGALPTSTS
jgi:hypothetical protein